MLLSLNVSEVRDEIWRAAGQSGDGAPSCLLLGQAFHDAFARLVTPGAGEDLDAILASAEPDLAVWNELVTRHAYRQLVFPFIQRNRPALSGSTAELLSFWTAVRALSDWLCRLRWSWTDGGTRETPLKDWILPEQPLLRQVRSAGLAEPVELRGVVDALVRRTDGAWCIVELKLGRSAPEADLAQGCLYHRMQLDNFNGSQGPQTGLSLVHFAPGLRETLYAAADLTAAQDRLLELIARLASRKSPAPMPRTPASLPSLPIAPPPVPPAAETGSLGKRIVAAFREYGARVELDGEPIAGPTFIRYGLKLGRAVQVNKVKKLDEELQLALRLDKPPFIHNERGRLQIDIQRLDRQIVTFDSVAGQFPAPDPLLGAPRAPIGVDLNNQLAFIDFSSSTTPHLLVAGTNGSGKSEWMISAIAGLMKLNSPDTLRLLAIDPKRNAFGWLRDSEYLYSPLVYPDEMDVVASLEGLVEEMDRRYQLFDGDPDLASYLRRTGTQLPRIFCVCDEFYDLLAADKHRKKEIESIIARLGSKARAAGIHLILATQQPSRQVISGVIDTNLPARVGLRTSKETESRMLLGEGGAENLLGKGDLFYKDIGHPRRYQAIYLSPERRAELAATRLVSR